MEKEINSIQFGLAILGFLYLAWLLFNGWQTGGIWVKGSRKTWDRGASGAFGKEAFSDAGQWGHKRYRDEDPKFYWGAVLFYSAGALLCLYIILKATILAG